MNFTHAARALRHRNFSFFLVGQGANLIGFWIQQIALNWLVYKLTGSALLLGITSFCGNIPILLLAPLAGSIADRVDTRRAMIVIQLLEMLQAVVLTVLAFTGLIEPWHIIVLSTFMGICVAFELPVRHAMMPDLVPDKADLPNAVALTSFVSNGGRLVGPSVAGVLILYASEAACFLINTFSYLVVLWALSMIRFARRPRPAQEKHILRDMADGALYAWRFTPVRVLLGVLAVMSFMALPYNMLMPAVVKQVYDGSSATLGFLVASAGFGAVAGTGYLSARSGVRGLIRLIIVAVALAGAALIAFSLSRSFWLSIPLLALVGFGILATTVSVQIILQTLVDDAMRGRVMSFYTVAFLGVAPLGSLAAGTIAEWLGAARTIGIGGTCCILAALYLATRRAELARHVGPIYDRLGIARRDA